MSHEAEETPLRVILHSAGGRLCYHGLQAVTTRSLNPRGLGIFCFAFINYHYDASSPQTDAVEHKSLL